MSLCIILFFDAVPSGRPQNVTNGSIRSRSAVITWEPPSEEDQNGIITNYTISVAVTGTNETFLLYSVSTSITIATLKPYTTYFLRVAASTSVGQGPPSTVLILSTPEDGKFSSVSCINVSEKSASIIVDHL